MSKKTRRYFARLRRALPKLRAFAKRVKAEHLPLVKDGYPVEKEIREIEEILLLHKHGSLQEVR